jgi:hypothetical protein
MRAGDWNVLARYRCHESQRDNEVDRIPPHWEKAVHTSISGDDRLLRRAARGGVWLVRHHYIPERRWMPRTYLARRMAAARA